MKIYRYPSYLLTEKTNKVKDFGQEFQSLVDLMIGTMIFNLGVGLAAPQVGEPLRIFVAQSDTIHILVNPTIKWCSFEMTEDDEGCLSIPRTLLPVKRFKCIGIDYQDRYGDKKEISAEDYLARIFQHEIDHLNGIMIINHIRL